MTDPRIWLDPYFTTAVENVGAGIRCAGVSIAWGLFASAIARGVLDLIDSILWRRAERGEKP